MNSATRLLCKYERKKNAVLKSVQIQVDQSIANKLVFQESYGGHGFQHLLKNVAPQMVVKGLTQKQVDKIFIDNPASILSYWARKSPLTTHQIWGKLLSFRLRTY